MSVTAEVSRPIVLSTYADVREALRARDLKQALYDAGGAVMSGALITLSSDVFGRNEVATANGLTGMAAWTASTMFALVVGALADTIGFSPLFAVLAIFDLLGAVVIWTVLKSKSADELAKESLGRPATQS